MRIVTAVFAILLAAGCSEKPKDQAPPRDPRLAAAEVFVDAFYSFDPASLLKAMATAPDTAPEILYYQGWAQGGNYVVLRRQPCRLQKADEVTCAITVRDDLIAALGTGFDVTDTFHLSFDQGRLASIRTSSNDPPQMKQAFDWLRAERPGLWDGPCRGFFAGGPTPQDCVRAVVKGFADFTARAPSAAKAPASGG